MDDIPEPLCLSVERGMAQKPADDQWKLGDRDFSPDEAVAVVSQTWSVEITVERE
jgi:hypothetical protein